MEQWDIYDENKQLTGRTMNRNDWNMQPGEFHLTVLGVLQRPDGKFLITRRKLDKEWAPGWWEVPGGGVRAGETSEQAVLRELQEETGIDASHAAGGYAFTYQRINPEEKNNYFVDIYKFILDFSEEDVLKRANAKYASKALILGEEDDAKEGIFLHYDSIRQVFEQ